MQEMKCKQMKYKIDKGEFIIDSGIKYPKI